MNSVWLIITIILFLAFVFTLCKCILSNRTYDKTTDMQKPLSIAIFRDLSVLIALVIINILLSNLVGTIYVINISVTTFSFMLTVSVFILLVIGILYRIIKIPKYAEIPTGTQNFMESFSGFFRNKAIKAAIKREDKKARKKAKYQAILAKAEAEKAAKLAKDETKGEQKPKKSIFRFKNLYALIGLIILYVLVDNLLPGGARPAAPAGAVKVLGMTLPTSVFAIVLILFVLIVLTILIRALYLKRFKDRPKGFQNILEGSFASFKSLGIWFKEIPKRSQLKKAQKIKEKRILTAEQIAKKKKKRIRNLVVFICWIAISLIITFLLPKGHEEEFAVHLDPDNFLLFGLAIRSTVVYIWIIMLVTIVLLILARIFVLPKLKDRPQGAQNLMEIIVEFASNTTREKVPHFVDSIAPHIITLGIILIGSAICEMFGQRSPATDLSVTIGLALMTFFFMNYYGIKAKKLSGRLKQFIYPIKLMVPFKILSDIAVPVSLSCRLFGNMLGGMIVVELLYLALGNFAAGIPAVAGLFFNVFHPLIQAFIFITLTLTFIQETTE